METLYSDLICYGILKLAMGVAFLLPKLTSPLSQCLLCCFYSLDPMK